MRKEARWHSQWSGPRPLGKDSHGSEYAAAWCTIRHAPAPSYSTGSHTNAVQASNSRFDGAGAPFWGWLKRSCSTVARTGSVRGNAMAENNVRTPTRTAGSPNGSARNGGGGSCRIASCHETRASEMACIPTLTTSQRAAVLRNVAIAAQSTANERTQNASAIQPRYERELRRARGT